MISRTIFVNPRQFGAGEDLSRYPRDEEGDLAKLAEAGAHLVFAPRQGEIYPEGFATTVRVAAASNQRFDKNVIPAPSARASREREARR